MSNFNPSPNVLAVLDAWDYFVFLAVLALTVISVIIGHLKKDKKANPLLDYMVMGRKLSLPLFVATLTASWYGGIFGVSEITFNFGLYNFITQGVFWYIAYIIFALFIAGKIRRYQSVTLPSLAEDMFGKKSGRTAAIFTFFGVLPISYVLSLGIFLQLVFGLSLIKGMILGSLFACLYSARGGLRAVVFADAVQFVVMCAAVLMVFLFSLHAFGGLSFLKANLPAAHFSLTGGNTWLNTFAWGAVALAALADPAFYQRVFAAKDIKTAKYGILICTAVWFCFDICTTAGALYARALLPKAAPSSAYFLYALQLLPSGLRGFFIAGVLAIVLSTLDAFLFIAANTLAYDLLKDKIKNKLLANQIALFAVAALAILLALFFEGNFRRIWFILGSYMSACLLIPLLAGYLWPKRISDNLFCLGALASAFTLTLWNILPRPAVFAELDGFYIGLLTNILILSFAILREKFRKTYERN